jgi:hypothetical protein
MNEKLLRFRSRSDARTHCEYLTLVRSWTTDGSLDDSEPYSGLQEHVECQEASQCRAGMALPPVPVSLSACQRGQILVNYRPTISGRYAFILDIEGSIGRSAAFAMAGIVCSFLVQARDMYGNANQAECLFNVQGRLIYERLLTSQHLEHGGSSIASLYDSMRTCRQ